MTEVNFQLLLEGSDMTLNQRKQVTVKIKIYSVEGWQGMELSDTFIYPVILPTFLFLKVLKWL